MARVRFKYCALYYLNQWLSKDSVYCQALANDDRTAKLRALSNAAGFYGIARNLRERHDVGRGLPRYGPVLEIIDAQSARSFEGAGLVPSVIRVSEEISAVYGDRKVLSLTTKFLWLKLKKPIIVYDRRARLALGTPLDNFEDYCTQWRATFESYT